MSVKTFALRMRDGTRICVSQQRGRGEHHCLLIHGLGDGRYVWHEGHETLVKHCSYTTVDLRGHGESDRSHSLAYNLSVYVDDVRTVIQILGLDRLVLIGHSLGADVALSLTGRLSGTTLDGVVLVDSSLECNPVTVEHLHAQLLEGCKLYGSIAEYESWLTIARPILSKSAVANIAANELVACGAGFRRRLDPACLLPGSVESSESRRLNWLRLLRALSCKTLLVRGQASAVVSVLAASNTVNMMRFGELKTIRFAGHAVMTDNSSEFWSCIDQFFSETLTIPERSFERK